MKILIVDDDMISRMALMEVVEQCAPDYRIAEAVDGQAAWEALQREVPPMMICCDGRMPRMSGLDLLRRVRLDLNHNDLPFVMISSMSDLDSIKTAATAGINGYIVKPFDSVDAEQRLKKVLEYANARMIEEPPATIQRLKITPERYTAYIQALNNITTKQLESVDQAQLDFKTFRQGLETLRTGSQTLGLWRAEQLLGLMLSKVQSEAYMREVLDEIHHQLKWQLEKM